jgi:hypothetical protein
VGRGFGVTAGLGVGVGDAGGVTGMIELVSLFINRTCEWSSVFLFHRRNLRGALGLGFYVRSIRDVTTILVAFWPAIAFTLARKSGVKFATANPSCGGPPHSKAPKAFGVKTFV